MAGKVFFSVTMSLDGFIAPEERMDNQDRRRWMERRMELQEKNDEKGGDGKPITPLPCG